jgi:hypothetical protein
LRLDEDGTVHAFPAFGKADAGYQSIVALQRQAATIFRVTTRLDPVVHADMQFTMDCRGKPGNDE